MTIEIDPSFTAYMNGLKEELRQDPTTFVPPRVYKDKPYREWSEQRKQVARAAQKRYHDKNPEKFKEYNRRWQREHKEHINAVRRKYWPKYYAKSRERILAHCRERYQRRKLEKC